jgi:competence protein ComEA
VLARIGLPNVALISAIVVAVVLIVAQRDPSRGLEIVRATPEAGVDVILVHVSGAVGAPGVIDAERGDRVVDAIERAGGFAREADQSAVNLARRVQDEDQIHVPRAGEANALLDLNRASAKELEELPGIGPVYAGRIVEARSAVPFSSSDELIEREVIPARTYEQIRDLVMAGPP